jgi:hypothetical protein
MKVTNRFNVPETLLALALRDDYNKGKADYSVTEIISPPRVQRLRKKHWDDMEQDVSDMLWQLMGSALHVVAEKGQAKNHITEERLITKIGNITLSGAMDIQQVIDGRILITDYKFTSAWALKADKFDWTAQQNIYAYLVREEKKMEVEGIRICALIRDWSRREAQYKADYPPAPIQIIDLPLWSHEETRAYIEERINAHNDAKAKADWDEELPHCTDEERWKRSDTFAVKKEGRKNAIRVLEVKEEADNLAKKENGYVEHRPGEPIRCSGNFCGVAKWCTQYLQEGHSSDEGSGVRPEGEQE